MRKRDQNLRGKLINLWLKEERLEKSYLRKERRDVVAFPFGIT
jgi:hypothetical protein